MSEPLTGLVLKYHANLYTVSVGETVFQCQLKGILKKEGTDVLVGDRVVLDSIDETNQSARITEILPRRNTLTRPKVANVDQVLVVHALRQPDFDYHQLDRYLTHATLAGYPVLICASKRDLALSGEELAPIEALYEPLGYRVLFTSIHEPDSLKDVLMLTRAKVTLLAGLSGAGKSSLLNVLNPSLDLKVGEVSEKISRGQHTTRHVELIEVAPELYVVDSPGFSNLKFDQVLPVDIEQVYPDFEPYRDQCNFRDCLHLEESESDETGCAVLANMEKIAPTRYESYCQMIEEAKGYRELLKKTSQKEEYGQKTLHTKGKDMRILKLKEKNRSQARNVEKQQVVTSWRDNDEESDEHLEDPGDSL